MKLRINANAIITNSENKILFIQLKKGPFEGRLSLPGGGINPGELSQEALKREILEETGIHLDGPIRPFGFCELVNKSLSDHRLVVLLHCQSDKEIFESEEGIPQWHSLGELDLLNEKLLPFAKETIKMWKNKKNYFYIITE